MIPSADSGGLRTTSQAPSSPSNSIPCQQEQPSPSISVVDSDIARNVEEILERILLDLADEVTQERNESQEEVRATVPMQVDNRAPSESQEEVRAMES